MYIIYVYIHTPILPEKIFHNDDTPCIDINIALFWAYLLYQFIAWISQNLTQPRTMTETYSLYIALPDLVLLDIQHVHTALGNKSLSEYCTEEVSILTPHSTCFCKWSPERLRARLLPDHYLLRCRSSNNLWRRLRTPAGWIIPGHSAYLALFPLWLKAFFSQTWGAQFPRKM